MKSLLRYALAALVLPVLYAIEPFWRIRLVMLTYQRIGHLSYDVDLFVRRRQLNGWEPRTTFLFFAAEPANRQLLAMWKRHLTILEGTWWVRSYFLLQPLLARTRFLVELKINGAEHREFTVAQPTLAFTEEEMARGRAELARMGIRDGEWFVCVHARTGRYLARHKGSSDWSYHDFRDCDIRNYIPAMHYITERGGFVLRMGAPDEEPLEPTGNERIIDYATRYHSDFMDIYLAAHCRFFLGSGSGLMCVTLVFNGFVANANYIPYRYIGIGRRMMHIPKLLLHAESDTPVTMQDVAALNLLDTSDPSTASELPYRKQGFRWIENTGQEVLELCMDMLDRLEDRAPSARAPALLERFASFYQGTANDSPDAGSLSPRFALRHAEIIEPGPVDEANQRAFSAPVGSNTAALSIR